MIDALPRLKNYPQNNPPASGLTICRFTGFVLLILSFTAMPQQQMSHLSATVELRSLSGSGVQGKLHMQQHDRQVVITGEVNGLAPGRPSTAVRLPPRRPPPVPVSALPPPTVAPVS